VSQPSAAPSETNAGRLRRIEIQRSGPIGELRRCGCGAYIGDFLDRLKMPVPPPDSFSASDTFWFTDAGWEKFGSKIYALLNEVGFIAEDEQLVVLELERGTTSISYEDQFQVAVKT